MNESNEVEDIFNIKNDQPDQTAANQFNQKIKEFYNPNRQLEQPITEPQVMPPLPQELTEKSKKGYKLFFIIGMIVVIIALGAGAAYYIFFSQPLPKDLVKSMIKRMEDVKSFHYEGDLSLSNDLLTTLKFKGEIDENNPQNKKSNILIDAEIATTTGSLNPEFEIRIINQDKYLRFNLGNLILFLPNLNPINNQWIRIDQDSLNKYLPINELPLNQKITTEKIMAIKNLINETNLFTNIKETKSEQINNIKVRHLNFEVDKNGIKSLIVGLNKIFEYNLNQQQINNIEEEITKLPSLMGEMWIGSKDHYLYKFIMPINFVENNQTIKINLNIQFSNFTQSFTIIAPTIFKTFDDLQKFIQEEQEKYFNIPTSTNSNLNINLNKDSDNDGLTDQQENLYGTNPLNPDSDNDGYLDGEEVQHGYNPLGPGGLNQ